MVSGSPKALSENLILYSSPFFENTAKVVVPSAIAPMGKIVLNLGSPRPDAGLVSRDLLDGAGNFAANATATKVAYPVDPATQTTATDNQLIRLQDGSLLALKNGYTWNDVSPRPEWFDTVDIRYGINPDGTNVLSKRARNALYLFRSTDAGQNWELWSIIDPAVVANGKYGWPGPYKKPDGSFGYSVGGFDRTEMYQDPWRGDIYVSGKGGGGPIRLHGKKHEYHAGVIFRSKDNGRNWETYYELDDPPPGNHKWGFPMTSTPNHRLVVFSVEGQPGSYQPTLHYVEKGVMSEGKTIIAKDHGAELKYEAGAGLDDIRGYPLCIAPNHSYGTRSSVWVAYPALNASKMQTYAVSTVTFGGVSEPNIILVANVAAEDPKKTSATMGAFIYDDRVDPDDQNTDLSCTLFYWLEAQPKTSTDSQKNNLLVRYQIFHSGQSLPPGYLSVANGTKRYFTRTGIGDYFSGGYFWLEGQLNFMAQWNEPDGIKANIVSLTPFVQINLIYDDFLKRLQTLPHPPPREVLRKQIDVLVRGLSIARRRAVLANLERVQAYVEAVAAELKKQDWAEDVR
jgi:hypothetical protein